MAQDNLNQVHSGDADITVTFTGMESILLLNLLSQSIREPGVRASGEVSNSIVALWRKISSLVEREVNCSDCLKIIKDEAEFVARIEEENAEVYSAILTLSVKEKETLIGKFLSGEGEKAVEIIDGIKARLVKA